MEVKIILLTAAEYDKRLVDAAKMGAAIALAEFTQQGGTSNPVLSVRDAAKFLRIGEGTLRSFVAMRQIPHFRIGRVIKFRRVDLIGWEPPAMIGADDPAAILFHKRKSK